MSIDILHIYYMMQNMGFQEVLLSCWRTHLWLAAAADGCVCRQLIERALDGCPSGRVGHELPGDCPLRGVDTSSRGIVTGKAFSHRYDKLMSVTEKQS